jgi:uncharacterized membrane protein
MNNVKEGVRMTRHIFRQFVAEHWGKILGGLAGLIIGMVFIIFGFWRSLFIFFCVVLGVYLGRMLDRNESMRSLLQRFWPDSD